jgi:flagellar M-ring protein FliF
MQQSGVEGLRVHIVVPEKSLFKEEDRPPTASIVLKLAPGLLRPHKILLQLVT